MGIFSRMGMVNKGLRYKLLLAFCLMSIIPLLACVYVIVNYLFPQIESLTTVSMVVVTAVFISILGLFLARSLVDPVVEMAIAAKMIASGQYDRSMNIATDDEIGNLALSINTMTQKIRSNLDELKTYGQKMREINFDVHRKVLALSSLLQIGDLISSGSIQLDSLLEMTVEKIGMLFESGFSALYMAKNDESDFLLKVEFGQGAEKVRDISIKRKGPGLLEGAISGHTVLSVDSATKPSKEMEFFRKSYGVNNMLAIPIYSGRRNFGLLIVGNADQDYKYKSEDVELIKVFAKQVTIAIESDMLNKKAEDLAIKDELTDLYNKSFILNRLGEEIKRAVFYQRPCSFIVFGIDDFTTFRATHGELVTEEVLKRIAKLVKDNIIPVGKAARIAGDEFAVLLPEKNKKEAFTIADDIRKKIESSIFTKPGTPSLTVSVGLSENPLDGATADELFKKAATLLGQARSSGRNKVLM